jgi:gluconate 2-dehydrogenase alpha chain
MVYRVDSNGKRATGVSYYGPDNSENSVEAEIVILAPFIYDNTRLLLLLSKTQAFPNGLANSSGQLGKHIMAHIGTRAFATFDDRYVNNFMGPNAQKHARDDFNADNYDHKDAGFIRGANLAIATAGQEGGPLASGLAFEPPHGMPKWGAAYRDFLAKYYARHVAFNAETENLPYADQTIDLDPDVRDAWGMPAPRLTYDWRRANERKAVAFIRDKVEELGRAIGAAHVWLAPQSNGNPGPHIQGGTRMGSDPKTSVVNKYSQTWDIPNLFVVGSSTFPTMSGFNPTLTIQAVAFLTADAIVNRYRKNPGPLV